MNGLDTSDDSTSAIWAFLKEVLAQGPIFVVQLEAKAREGSLLSEKQSIVHAKGFRRAKKMLNIRSTRTGFGAAGCWSWALPPDRRSDPASPAVHASPNALNPGQELRLEPQPQRGGIDVPKTWRDKVASLRRRRPPADVPLHRWQLFLGDCEDFLDPRAIWAAKAVSFGWDALSLFGCAPAQPLAHMQVAGLIWALRGRKIVRLYPDWASIEDSADGSRSVFNRRVTYGVPIALPWSLR
jgi:hypothetical protein